MPISISAGASVDQIRLVAAKVGSNGILAHVRGKLAVVTAVYSIPVSISGDWGFIRAEAVEPDSEVARWTVHAATDIQGLLDALPWQSWPEFQISWGSGPYHQVF